MEKFLTELYREEMDKQASADLEAFLTTQPIHELEALLGIEKKAVAGSPEAPLPSSLPNKTLEAKMKLLDTVVAKSRGEKPPTREQEAAVGHSNYEGEQKKASVDWADQMGRKLAHVMAKEANPMEAAAEAAPGLLRRIGGQLHDVGRGAAMHGLNLGDAAHALVNPEAVGMSRAYAAGHLAAPAAALTGTAALAHHLGKRSGRKEKNSQGVGDGAGMGEQGGQGMTSLGGLGDTGVGEDKTAIACAKVASMAMKAVQGAPPEIRKVAAAMAGQKIAAARKQGYSRPFRS
jgi:hypothetical protein